MSEEIYNLSNEEIEELKKRYLIPMGTKESYKEDIDTIIQMREKIRNIVLSFLQGSRNGDAKFITKGIDWVFELAYKLEGYMKSSQPSNVVRRMRFVRNIEEEFKDALKLCEKSNAQGAEAIFETVKDVSEFLQLVASNALLEEGLLEDLENQNAMLCAEFLKQDLKRNILNFVDADNIGYVDAYYVLAHCLNQAAVRSKEYNEFYNENCENCHVDDCMLHHCAIFETINRKGDVMLAYQRLVEKFIARLRDDRVFSSDSVDSNLRVITNEKVKSVSREILTDSYPAYKAKRKNPLIDLGEIKNKYIDETKVKVYLTKSLSLGKGIDYNNLDDVLIYLLLTDFDYSKATAKNEHEKFIKAYQRLQMELKKGVKEGVDYLNINDLVDKYYENGASFESNESSDEPGGD